jgi:predicted ATPase/class 3 adenylate cyclase
VTDVRALLVTDVVDSTRLVNSLGDEASAALWTAHDRIARDLLRDWRGREIDKTDGFLLLFATAQDALGYAHAYHHAIAGLDSRLKARAGLHVGAVVLRENPAADVAMGAKPVEVEGIAKPIAARVMSLAGEGQTLLTAAAARELDAGHALRCHGHWRLKGVPQTIEIFDAEGASGATAPVETPKAYRVALHGDVWVPVREMAYGLRAERDAFIGRRELLIEIGRRIDEGARLVSLLGIGGCGKTRLALRFAWESLGEFQGGAWFCDLTAARSIHGIVHAVADALQVPLGKEDATAQLGNAIASRGRCLVILDNFEQVAQHADETLGRWLNRADQAVFIVTTRDVLGIGGEQTLGVAPLLPADAAALFVRRAESASHGFALAPDEEVVVAELVRLLDGLPLAIELAAARVRVMSPRTLLARMSERFKVLASSGARRDRQATLRSTFDWSWELLSSMEQRALAQLSVFEGGFTLESAEAVLDVRSNGEEAWIPAIVQSLVDKSFVQQAQAERFRLLVSVQEYAAEHLATEGRFAGSGPAAAQAAQRRHFRHFASFDESRAMAAAGADLDNLVVACRRAVALGARDEAVRTLEASWAALRLRGPIAVTIELANRVNALEGLYGAAKARAERVLGTALHGLGRVDDAARHLEAALALSRAAGDEDCVARTLAVQGWAACGCAELAVARACFDEVGALAARVPDPVIEFEASNGLAMIERALGNLDSAHEHFSAALAVARKAGDRRREGRTLGNLGIILLEGGRLEAARELYESALGAAREMGDRQWEGNTLCNLGLLFLLEGRLAPSRATLESALGLSREMGMRYLEMIALINLGLACACLRDVTGAETALDRALHLARDLHDRRSQGQALGYLGIVQARQGAFDAARHSLAQGEQLLLDVSDRISLAILQCCRAEAEHLAGWGDAARAALANAEAMAREAGRGGGSELGCAIARARAAMA